MTFIQENETKIDLDMPMAFADENGEFFSITDAFFIEDSHGDYPFDIGTVILLQNEEV